LLAATGGQLSGADRNDRLRRLAMSWVFMAEDRLPARYLAELWPDISGVHADLDVGISHLWELPYGERAVLDALVRFLRPMRILEIGTFTGTTTRLFADASPAGGVVHTIDLPTVQVDAETERSIGRAFREQPEYRDRIVQHRDGSRGFDVDRWRGQMDLVFVDAGHEYADLIHDSRLALAALAPEGVIVWDDYQATQLGVVEALSEVARQIPIVRIAHTRLALHSRRPFATETP
jgi:predicted O-methyltransferase YrrM